MASLPVGERVEKRRLAVPIPSVEARTRPRSQKIEACPVAMWNRKLVARLPEPVEVAEDGWVCLSHQCEDKAVAGNPVRMVVAAKWVQENSFVCPDNRPDNVANLGTEFPHAHNQGCDQGRYSRDDQTAEYQSPRNSMPTHPASQSPTR